MWQWANGIESVKVPTWTSDIQGPTSVDKSPKSGSIITGLSGGEGLVGCDGFGLVVIVEVDTGGVEGLGWGGRSLNSLMGVG